MNFTKAIFTLFASANALMIQSELEHQQPLTDALSRVAETIPTDVGHIAGSGVIRPLESSLVENLPDASSPLEKAYLEYSRQFALTLGNVGIYSAYQWLWDDDFTGANREATRSIAELTLGNQLSYEEYERNHERWSNHYKAVKPFSEFTAEVAYELYTRAVFMAELNAWQEYSSLWDY